MKLNKKGQMYSLWIMLIFITLMTILIAWNTVIISNNSECISIKFDEGENNNFCSCVKRSKLFNIGWMMPELEQDYEDILNKFCRD